VAAPTLQALIGTALTDSTFRHSLLNGSRRRILQSFPLTHQEIEIIMAIRADSLEQFASEVHQRFLADEEPEPLPPVYLGHRRYGKSIPFLLGENLETA
jgi:hypothetical protein